MYDISTTSYVKIEQMYSIYLDLIFYINIFIYIYALVIQIYHLKRFGGCIPGGIISVDLNGWF